MDNNDWYNIECYNLVRTENSKVHLGWWIFWLLVFWPALVIVFVMHTTEKYVVVIKYIDGLTERYTLSSSEYYRLQATARSCPLV